MVKTKPVKQQDGSVMPGQGRICCPNCYLHYTGLTEVHGVSIYCLFHFWHSSSTQQCQGLELNTSQMLIMSRSAKITRSLNALAVRHLLHIFLIFVSHNLWQGTSRVAPIGAPPANPDAYSAGPPVLLKRRQGPKIETPLTLNRHMHGGYLLDSVLQSLTTPPCSLSGYMEAHQFYESMREAISKIAYSNHVKEVFSLRCVAKAIPLGKQAPVLLEVRILLW